MKNFNMLGEACPIVCKPKLLLIMRLTLFISFMLSFSVLASSYSQDTQINLEVKTVTVKSVLKMIEEQTSFRFFYNSDLVDLDKQVSVSFNNKNLTEVLNSIFSETSVGYRVMENDFVVLSSAEMLQQATITGTIVDETGDPMPGVNVIVKGTLTGTVTDIFGKFSINAPDKSAILVLSFIGYVSQELVVGDETNFNVTLAEDSHQIEEVVVVGYGSQKKVNMTGAVSAVDISKMTESRPITSLSSGLSGLSSGVFVTQGGGGRPGNDGATIRVRGQGTLNNSDPLVVIDGTVGDMNDVNPQDVASISVLKDAASSAIYGSRAANGVILITTKKGKSGEAKINYNGFVTSQKVSNKMNIVSNYADYMELINEGYKNSKIAEPFSKAKIDEWRNAGDSDPLRYPNTDWQDDAFKKGLMQSHTLSMSGGTEKARYFISGNYLDNPGVMENSGYDRYSARVNIDADVKTWLTVGVNAYGYVAKNDIGTLQLASDKTDGVFTFAQVTTPGMVFRASDGRYGGMNNAEDAAQSSGNNPLYRLNNTKGNIGTNKVVSRFYATLKPFKGFTVDGSYTYDYTNADRYSQPVFIDRWDFYNNTISAVGTGRTSVTNKDEKWFRNQMDVVLRYERRFGRLEAQIMGGASQESYKYKWFQAAKYDLITEEASALNAATADANATGTTFNWAMHSFFSRLNLTWADKYMFEANIRADGSSRFASGSKRWGTFPSFSAGWRISEEDFLKDQRWLHTLKLRASWGALGNNALGKNRDNDGNYLYQTLYGESSYSLANSIQLGLAQKDLSNPNLTWETTYVSNFGLDFAILRNKLSGSIDYFIKNTEGILIDLPAPLVHGSSKIPKQNAAKVRNNGIEMNLTWADQIGEVGYFVNGNFSYVKNKVTKFKGSESAIDGTDMILEGKPINIQYLLSVDRIVQTDEDLALVQAMVDRDPAAFAAYKRPEKGDFLYKDTNDDGKINDADRITVGDGTNPLVTYGLSLGASWKGIDFSCLLQGSAGLKIYWSGTDYRSTVRHGYQINQDIADGRWYEGRTDADFPRLLEYTDTRNSIASDHWIQNKSYLRVKNIQLGYTFPKHLSQKILLETLRIYGSIDNAFTFTKYKGLDPEVSGTKYPPLRQMTIGLNLTF